MGDGVIGKHTAGKKCQCVAMHYTNNCRWESFAGEDGGEPRLYELPPPLQAIAVRPLTLDSAQSYITIPSVKHRFPAQAAQSGADAATSTFARFFTWGGAK